MSNQIQALAALRRAQEEVLEARTVMWASRDVQWVSTNAQLYLDRTADLIRKTDAIGLKIDGLQTLHRQLFVSLPQE